MGCHHGKTSSTRESAGSAVQLHEWAEGLSAMARCSSGLEAHLLLTHVGVNLLVVTGLICTKFSLGKTRTPGPALLISSTS